MKPGQQPLIVFRLRGSQQEMGQQHGELLRQAGGFEEALRYYPTLPERLLFGDSGDRVASRLVRWLKEAMLLGIERDRPREYRERSVAFMEALGMPRRHARYLMVMDVFQNMVGLAARHRLGPFGRQAAAAAVPACSSLAVWDGASAGGQLRHARNFDFPGIGVWDRAPALVFCDPDRGMRYGFVTTRGADTPGVTAFNEAGLTLSAHTRLHQQVAAGGGAAVVDLGHHIVRHAESLADAVRLAAERRVSSTWGLMISSARERRALVIETTASGLRLVEPARDHLTCANRYRHRDNHDGEITATHGIALHSDAREQRLAELVESARSRGGMTAADLETALDDRIDPGAPGVVRGAGAVVSQPCTVKSIVAEPESRVMRVAAGPAPTSRGPWVPVPWQWDGEVGSAEIEPGVTVAADEGVERAREHFAEANRMVVAGAHRSEVMAEVERAVALSPDDPGYRFLAGVWRLDQGWPESALAHFEAALERESIPYRRAQVLFWGARAADAAGQSVRARTWRDQLLVMDGEEVAELRARAQRDSRRGGATRRRSLFINMVLAEAV